MEVLIAAFIGYQVGKSRLSRAPFRDDQDGLLGDDGDLSGKIPLDDEELEGVDDDGGGDLDEMEDGDD